MNKPEHKSDSFLVLDVQSGNTKSLVLLIERWHKELCEKAYWIVKDSDLAKDIAQDCWSIVIQKIYELKDPESFGSWISRIVYRKALDNIKKSERTHDMLEQFKYQEETLIQENDFDTSREKMLLIGIKLLPTGQQMVVRLFYLENYSLKEIGKLLNISIGTAKSRLFKARETLKKTLKQKTDEMSHNH